ncbi:unnamed protein product [Oppiella nova]|uniref:Nuclear receptor domain-containing protein n=1 Tax=Oppiella nova TaxID=334625 RepID=A0A7R9LSX8_9ACAR|nr:unnamed protein product [Oppiella nova]CAG2166622.1 unnamed protein product [Oppiella nova]
MNNHNLQVECPNGVNCNFLKNGCRACRLQKCLDIGMTPPNQQNGSQQSTTLAPSDDLENSQAQTHPQPPIASSGDTAFSQSNIVYIFVPTIQVPNPDAGPFTSYPSHLNTVSYIPHIGVTAIEPEGDHRIDDINPNQNFIQQPLQPIDPNSMAVVAENPIQGPDVPSDPSTTIDEPPYEEMIVSELPIENICQPNMILPPVKQLQYPFAGPSSAHPSYPNLTTDVVPIELTSSEPKECQQINTNAIQNTSTTNETNISQSNGLYQTVVANNQIQELASEPPTINTDFNSNSLSNDSQLISPESLQYTEGENLIDADLLAPIEANNTDHRVRIGANNGYNFGVNSTDNRNNCMDTTSSQPNLTHTSGAQTVWPYTEPLTPSYGTSTSVHSFKSTSSHLVTNSINTDNNILHPVLQDLFDLELPTNEGTVGQGPEYTYANGAYSPQQLQSLANTSTAVESYETGLASQPNVYNNIVVNQTDDSHNNIVYDMIHTLVNKINLGLITATNEDPLLAKMKKIQIYENKGQKLIKEIADELMQKGPGRFKQLFDTAGLRLREAEDVLKMFITKEPWECTTDVELKVIKASKLRSGDSQCFQMNSHPRGRAIIFVTTDGLNVEILRWYSIFAQLDFKCEIYVDFTCSQIKDNLLGVSCQRFVADALFVMVIGRGFDQKIYGCGNRGVDNEMSFTDIVDIFSANNPKNAETTGR